MIRNGHFTLIITQDSQLNFVLSRALELTEITYAYPANDPAGEECYFCMMEDLQGGPMLTRADNTLENFSDDMKKMND